MTFLPLYDPVVVRRIEAEVAIGLCDGVLFGKWSGTEVCMDGQSS
ncbi:hypothetical protein [Microvirga sp. VF16]|nr:hypothetical protein [Microvirga sp. VF16]